MEPASATFKPYGVEDGLLSREFNAHAYAAARDGRLYFGGILGVNFFNPDSMPANTHAPDVVLTEIHLFGKTLALKPAVGWRDRIDLEYDQNHVGLSFAALDFTSPRHNRYAYRLLEVDRDWNDAGTTRSATYAYLSPGEYVFEVKASNNDGVWNPEPARLTIVIHPPFWATWYFRITVLVVVLLLLRAGYRRRIQSIKAREKYLEEVVTAKTAELRTKNEELQKANHLKNEFLGIAAHDLRNPLNAIVGYADLMREDVIRGILKPDHLHDLAQIVKSSRDMAALIEDLLNVSAIESGDLKLREHPADLIVLLENCIEKCKREAARKNIRVEFKPDVRECMVYCDAIKINEVVDNLLSNAVKFTFTGGAVALVTETMPQHVHIHVQDGGPGLKDSDFQFLFSSFKKLSARPTGGESSTGLGLAIVKKIVELHGGRVWAVNRPDAGAQFSFSLERSANRQSPAAGF
jgi:signal transduction histidine kinase